MTILSNAGPIIVLDRIDRLHVLPTLFSTVIIPAAVRQDEARGKNDLVDVESLDWLQTGRVNNPVAVSLLHERLEARESEVFVLALVLDVDVLLMEEPQGRWRAQGRDLFLTGAFGVLLLAKEDADRRSGCAVSSPSWVSNTLSDGV